MQRKTKTCQTTVVCRIHIKCYTKKKHTEIFSPFLSLVLCRSYDFDFTNSIHWNAHNLVSIRFGYGIMRVRCVCTLNMVWHRKRSSDVRSLKSSCGAKLQCEWAQESKLGVYFYENPFENGRGKIHIFISFRFI